VTWAETSEYRAWTEWLGAFGRGEDRPCTHLPPMDDRLGPYVLGRLHIRVSEAFLARQRIWVDRWERDLRTGLAVTSLAAILHATRGRAAPLAAFITNPLLPAELRNALRESLTTMLRTAQQAVDDATRHSCMEVRAVVREHNLESALTVRPAPPAGKNPPGRRVML